MKSVLDKSEISGGDAIAENNKWVPIKREETSIYLKKYKTTSPESQERNFLKCYPGHVQFKRFRV